MKETHFKSFRDRYEQSREYFFLDFLNRIDASVPQIYKNDVQNKRIEMEYVGSNLQTFLSRLSPKNENSEIIFSIVKQVLDVCLILGNKNIWHMDLALRNFTIQENEAHRSPKVFLIDFSLAVSPHFPLQKPLWLRTDEVAQHPLFRQAIVSDWRNFFLRNQLPVPDSFGNDLEISILSYDADFSSKFAVESLELNWCVMAHSLGAMFLKMADHVSLHSYPLNHILKHASSLLNIYDDRDAFAQLENLRLFVGRMVSEDTPKPGEIIDKVLPDSTPKPTIKRADEVPESSINPSHTPVGSSIFTPVVEIGDSVLVSPAVRFLKNKNASRFQFNFSFVRIFICLLMVTSGYYIINSIYASSHTELTNFIQIFIGLIGLFTFLQFITLITSERKALKFATILRSQGLLFIVFSIEIWSLNVTDLGAAIVLVLGLLIFPFSGNFGAIKS